MVPRSLAGDESKGCDTRERVKANRNYGASLSRTVGTVFVERSITEARETLLLTAGLVILIIFLFLATLRATIIPALAIPVSIIATFAILSALNYSINTFTLLGRAIAVRAGAGPVACEHARVAAQRGSRPRTSTHQPDTRAL